MDYLPPILSEVVQGVSDAMTARTSDPFAVSFAYGLFQNISQEVYKNDLLKVVGGDPLVYLLMPYDQNGDTANCDIIIALPTDPKWSMAERDANSFYPRLFPVYDALVEGLKGSKELSMSYLKRTDIKYRVLPYWGGDESGNANQKNLFDRNVDAIHIKGIDLKIKDKKQNC